MRFFSREPRTVFQSNVAVRRGEPHIWAMASILPHKIGLKCRTLEAVKPVAVSWIGGTTKRTKLIRSWHAYSIKFEQNAEHLGTMQLALQMTRRTLTALRAWCCTSLAWRDLGVLCLGLVQMRIRRG